MLSCRQSYPWGVAESLHAQPVFCTGVLLVRHGTDQVEKQDEFAGLCLRFRAVFTRGCAELHHFPSHRKVLAPQKLNVPFCYPQNTDPKPCLAQRTSGVQAAKEGQVSFHIFHVNSKLRSQTSVNRPMKQEHLSGLSAETACGTDQAINYSDQGTPAIWEAGHVWSFGSQDVPQLLPLPKHCLPCTANHRTHTHGKPKLQQGLHTHLQREHWQMVQESIAQVTAQMETEVGWRRPDEETLIYGCRFSPTGLATKKQKPLTSEKA